jgi:hypothetical protein
MGSFCNNCSPSLYSATALPLKAETFRSLAAMADVFFIQCVDYGVGEGAVTTTEATAGSIKAEQRRPRKGGTEQDRGKEPSKTERKKIHRKKQRKHKQRNPEKTNINITVSSIPPANQKKKEPKQQAVTFIITGTKGKQKEQVYTDENEITVLQASSRPPEAGKPFSFSLHSCF